MFLTSPFIDQAISLIEILAVRVEHPSVTQLLFQLCHSSSSFPLGCCASCLASCCSAFRDFVEQVCTHPNCPYGRTFALTGLKRPLSVKYSVWTVSHLSGFQSC